MKPTPAQLRALARRDPALGRAMKRLDAFPGFPGAAQKVQKTHFHALCRSIVYQQLAGAAAKTIHDRVCALTEHKGFPKPDEVLAIEDARLRGAGLSLNKLLALRDLAGRVARGELDLQRVARRSDERVIEELIQVRGIGEWSAHMFLMFRLGRLDVMAPGDLGVREGVRRLDGLKERPTPKEALARSEVWRPLRTVACWYMWRLTEEKQAAKS
jgi:DNA-3-methyladenine glycosylase II